MLTVKTPSVSSHREGQWGPKRWRVQRQDRTDSNPDHLPSLPLYQGQSAWHKILLLLTWPPLKFLVITAATGGLKVQSSMNCSSSLSPSGGLTAASTETAEWGGSTRKQRAQDPLLLWLRFLSQLQPKGHRAAPTSPQTARRGGKEIQTHFCSLVFEVTGKGKRSGESNF